jgi:hypothetical protein
MQHLKAALFKVPSEEQHGGAHALSNACHSKLNHAWQLMKPAHMDLEMSGSCVGLRRHGAAQHKKRHITSLTLWV